MHVLKDCNNVALGHELVPIVTMSDPILPEVLESAVSISQYQNQAMPPSSLPQLIPNMMTGVYTLPEEPELEAMENTPM